MGAVPAEQLDEWQAGKHCFGTGSSAKLEPREEERAGAHRPAPRAKLPAAVGRGRVGHLDGYPFRFVRGSMQGRGS
jgi:hypothetical protein